MKISQTKLQKQMQDIAHKYINVIHNRDKHIVNKVIKAVCSDFVKSAQTTLNPKALCGGFLDIAPFHLFFFFVRLGLKESYI